MTLEEFYLYHEENFDSFSKSTIKRFSAKIFNEIAAKSERETYLPCHSRMNRNFTQRMPIRWRMTASGFGCREPLL